MWLLLILTTSSPAQANIADEYEDYVNQMIPLSYRFVEVNAGLKEHEVLLNLLSQQQAELSKLDQNLTGMSEYANELMSNSLEKCPVTVSGTIDIGKTLALLYRSSRLNAKVEEAERHLQAYQRTKVDHSNACIAGFEHHHLGNEDFKILIPHVELADGVFFSYGNPFKAFFDLLSSAFNMIINQDEQKRIDDSSRKFQNERANEAYLRAEAKKACELNQAAFAPIFKSLDEYAESSRAKISGMAALPWARLSNALRTCLRVDESRKLLGWIGQAKAEVPAVNSSVPYYYAKIKSRMQMLKLVNNDCSSVTSLKRQSAIATAEVLLMGNEPTTLRLKEMNVACEGVIRD